MEREMKGESTPKKIWFAIETPFQVNFFHSIMKRLQNKFEFLVTARDHDKIIPMLEAKNIEYVKVGRHGSKLVNGKMWTYTETIQQLIPIVKKEKPDLLLTGHWPEAVRTAFGFNIPAWTLFYDERDFHANLLTFPLSTKIFCPTFYTPQDLKQQGVIDQSKVVWFNGFHTCYLKDYDLDDNGNPFTDMGFEPPIVLVRTEPEFAAYFQEKQLLLEKTVERLTKKLDASVVVFPRSTQQASRYPEKLVMPSEEAFCDAPVAYADVVVGAAETMLMESFVISNPVVSAIYWQPSKPVVELHKYVPHCSDPEQIVAQAERFLNRTERRIFKENAKNIVGKMENPAEKIINEIRNVYEFGNIFHVERSPRRSQMEICADILRVIACRPSKFTHILQSANISHKELKRDLTLLMRHDLLENYTDNLGGIYYRITSKGLRTLQEYEKVRSELSL
jgi:predicted glycosyltransferase/predicted transcriptional regulator